MYKMFLMIFDYIVVNVLVLGVVNLLSGFFLIVYSVSDFFCFLCNINVRGFK